MANCVNDDCWYFVLTQLQDDCHTLFQLLLVSKSTFRTVVPFLYRQPFLDYNKTLTANKKLKLQTLLYHHAAASARKSNKCLTTATATLPSTPSPTPTTMTCNYYDFVHEMPDIPPNDKHTIQPLDSENFHLRLSYQRRFAEKMKKIQLPIFQCKLFGGCLSSFNHLQELIFYDAVDWSYPKVSLATQDIVRKVLVFHQARYPGVLKKVSFLRSPCDPIFVGDPEMMIRIRDWMNGQWCTDSIIFRIPEQDQDPYLMTILQDLDLPTRLRSIKIWPVHHGILMKNWTKPLGKFLSRCRNLDHVDLEGCPPEALAWAVEEQRYNNCQQEKQPPQPLISSTNVCGGSCSRSVEDMYCGIESKSAVSWKSIRIAISPRIDINNQTVDLHERQAQLAWWNALMGFAHCVEVFRFQISLFVSHFDYTSYPALSLPESIALPNLYELGVSYPRFEEFSISQLNGLRKLCFKSLDAAKTTVDKQEPWLQPGLANKFPIGLEELQLCDITLSTLGLCSIKSLKKLTTLTTLSMGISTRCKFQVIKDQERFSKVFDQLQFLSEDYLLPRLSKVSLAGYSAQYLHINTLLMGPNLTTLNLSAAGPMNFTNFFSLENVRSRSFSSLKSLITESIVILNPIDLGCLLNLVEGIDMFPKLEQLSLGPVRIPMQGNESRIEVDDKVSMVPFIQFIQEALLEDHQRCQRSGRRLNFDWRKLDLSSWKQWEKWLTSKRMGFQVRPMVCFNCQLSGLVFLGPDHFYS